MAAYASIADANALYGEDYVIISFDRNGDSILDETSANRFLDVATTTINSYLRGRVTLPLATVPDDVKKYCVDMAIYDGCPKASVMTTQKEKRYDAAITWLKGVRDNKVSLVDNDGNRPGGSNQMHEATAVPMVSNKAEIIPGAREMTRETLSLLI